MNELDKIYLGFVTQYDRQKHYGFVESGDHSFYFYDDLLVQVLQRKNGEIDKIHVYRSGDEVEFKLKHSLRHPGKVVAYDLKFIRNVKVQELIDEANEKESLLGQLKIFDENRFFVKHVTTHVYVPIKVDKWEIDLHAVYLERINQQVKFKLNQTKKLDKMVAVLTDRKFPIEYFKILELIKAGQSTKAYITGRNTHGLFATILEGSVEGFISLTKSPTPEETEEFLELEKGETALVIIKTCSDSKQVTLKLAME